MSTPTTNAIDNALTYTGVPIYNTAGQLIATGSSLWSGSIQNPVGYNQFGIAIGPPSGDLFVWTGTLPGGTVSEDPVGVFTWYPKSGVWGIPSWGFAIDATDEWLYTGTTSWESQGGEPPASICSYSLYALSSPITVPVPEPSTLALLARDSLGSAGSFVFGGVGMGPRPLPLALPRMVDAPAAIADRHLGT